MEEEIIDQEYDFSAPVTCDRTGKIIYPKDYMSYEEMQEYYDKLAKEKNICVD